MSSTVIHFSTWKCKLLESTLFRVARISELHFQDRDIDIMKWVLVNDSEEFDDSL